MTGLHQCKPVARDRGGPERRRERDGSVSAVATLSTESKAGCQPTILPSVDYDATRAVLTALERHGVRYAVFGAVALNLHGLARFTEDLDLFIEPERSNIDRLVLALKEVFVDPTLDEISADDLLGEYPAIQYVPPEGTFRLDLLTRLGEAFAFSDLEIERVSFDDVTVSVASPRTLYRMKRDTVRLKDKADAEMLRRQFDLGEQD